MEDMIKRAVEKLKEMGCDEVLIMPMNGVKAWDENGVEYTMMPSAQPDLESAYAEGWTAAESNYRKMLDEMNRSEKPNSSNGQRLIDAMPTIEPDHFREATKKIEPKKGKWISEELHYKDAEQEYYYIEDHCSECGAKREIGWAGAKYCPNCGCELMRQEGEEHG